jgi:hypothetical protein
MPHRSMFSSLSVLSLSFGALAACSGSDPQSSSAQSSSLASDSPRTDRDTDFSRRHPRGIARHVLLLSIDGLHAEDLSRFVSAHSASALAGLAERGVQYTSAYVNRLDGTPTNPSDSFPGLLALVTGGSSKTTGGWYDVSYARDLYAYSATSPCSGPSGTSVAYDESIDMNNAYLWGSETDDTPTHELAVLRGRIDPTLLPYAKSGTSCAAVYPHQFLRVSTIFNVAKDAGLHTAWSDKHLAYELVGGPSGDGVDDFFAPEINSDPANSLLPSATPGGAFTDKWTSTEAYDDFKVAAILNEIDGRWSDDGLVGATDTAGRPGVPAIFGMNFQAVSVAQKDASANGGYADASGTPGPEVADALVHTDASIGRMVRALRHRGLLEETLIIVTAKHGQSPIDKSAVKKVDPDAVAALIGSVAPVAGHIEDDVLLYWLKDPTQAAAAASVLLHPPVGSVAPEVEVVMTTSTEATFRTMFGDPTKDARTPDLIVKPLHGVIYTRSKKKDAEHGGFADDDSHVGLLVSSSRLEARVVDDDVRTKQVAPTILRALGLDPQALDAVRAEGTRVLPELFTR